MRIRRGQERLADIDHRGGSGQLNWSVDIDGVTEENVTSAAQGGQCVGDYSRAASENPFPEPLGPATPSTGTRRGESSTTAAARGARSGSTAGYPSPEPRRRDRGERSETHTGSRRPAKTTDLRSIGVRCRRPARGPNRRG